MKCHYMDCKRKIPAHREDLEADWYGLCDEHIASTKKSHAEQEEKKKLTAPK